MVVPYSGNFMAVGGFTFFGGKDFGGGGKFSAVMPYRGNVSAVGGFSFFGGNDFGGGGKTKSGNFTAGKLPTIDEKNLNAFHFFRTIERKD